MVSASVTLRTLSLGASDTTTGWYAKTYAETTIDMVICHRGASQANMPAGFHSVYQHTGYTASPVYEDDEVTDAFSDKYKVLSVARNAWLDSHSHYVCELSNLQGMPIVRPSTFGTGITVEDARDNTKEYIYYYLHTADPPDYEDYLLKDDNATPASYLIQYAFPDYSLKRIFNTKAVDIVFSVGTPDTRVDRVGYTGAAKSYIENVPIFVHTVDKTEITGANLLWRGEWVLRAMVENYAPAMSTTWAGSYRSISRVRDASQNLGGYHIYGYEFVLSYMRDLT